MLKSFLVLCLLVLLSRSLICRAETTTYCREAFPNLVSLFTAAEAAGASKQKYIDGLNEILAGPAEDGTWTNDVGSCDKYSKQLFKELDKKFPKTFRLIFVDDALGLFIGGILVSRWIHVFIEGDGIIIDPTYLQFFAKKLKGDPGVMIGTFEGIRGFYMEHRADLSYYTGPLKPATISEARHYADLVYGYEKDSSVRADITYEIEGWKL